MRIEEIFSIRSLKNKVYIRRMVLLQNQLSKWHSEGSVTCVRNKNQRHIRGRQMKAGQTSSR